ncbi:MAG TPA: hypothetical protein DIC56_10015 [Rhizobium sp.]|nr:hypothetical protein [Rhizobium sp.]
MAIDLNAPVVGAYCERASSGFWAEPFNAGSSLLVIVFGFAAVGYLLRSRLVTPLIMVLMGLAVAIGIGSFLLHTFATRWAELADVIPIWAFVVVYGVAVARKFSPNSVSMTTTLLFGVIVFGAGTALSMGDKLVLADEISGSSQYLPAGLMIASVLRLLWKDRHPSLLMIGLAALLFIAALAFRSLDQPLCSLWPIGTHFLWHMTNSIVFWLLLSALVVHDPANSSRLGKTQSIS